MGEFHSTGRITTLGAIALSCFCIASGAALAQQAETGTLEEITVTAQKRTENAQNVPISISAFSADMLQQKSITTVEQLSNLSPNVNLDAGTPFSGSDTVLSAYIRGVGQNDFAFNLDPGVGVYVDGVYLARSVGANTTMLDVDRVEILKGPQGTLFGRNSIGGAISIVTREPGQDFKVKGEVTAGSFSRLDTKISMDVPFTDKILSTFSFSEEKRDGYQKRIPYVQSNAGGTAAGIPDCTTITCPYVVDSAEQFPQAGYQSGQTQGGINASLDLITLNLHKGKKPLRALAAGIPCQNPRLFLRVGSQALQFSEVHAEPRQGFGTNAFLKGR